MKRHLYLYCCFGFVATLLQSCVVYAPLPPMVTAGGPETATKGHSELALAVGTGFSLFPNAHAGGTGWYAHWRYGATPKFNCGIDAMGVVHSDKGCISLKFAGRYMLSPHLRLELGLGAADDSYGKSLNSEVALTLGTIKPDKVWHYYTSLRVGGALGYPGNLTGANGETAPPNTFAPVLSIGTTAKIIPAIKFFFEGGGGIIFPKRELSGGLIFLGAGLLFDAGNNGLLQRKKKSSGK